MKLGVSLATTAPLPRTRSTNARIPSSTSGPVSAVGVSSTSLREPGGVKKWVPRNRRRKPSERPWATLARGSPEVLELTTAAGPAVFSTRASSSCLGSRRSTMASTTQSASATRSKSSSKVPRRMRSASRGLARAAGRAASMRSNPPSTASRSRSSRSTARPALAAWAAMAAPMVPAPSTATRRMSLVKDAPPGRSAFRGYARSGANPAEGTPAMSERNPASTDFYRIDDLLTDGEREVRDRVRAFCDKEVTPVINDYWERAEFPFELVPKLAALNLAGGTIQGYGCPGLSTVATGLVGMELGRGDGSICTFFGVHSGLAMTSIALLGSEEQKRRWLPPMARMEQLGAFGLTEPDHGSDAVALETRARRDGDHWVLDGAKRWIGNASFADLVIVWARDDDGKVGGFVVEKGTPGYAASVMSGKTAKRAVWQAEITLDGVRVPAGSRLANSRGFGDTARVLTATRSGVAWEAAGHALAAYEAALTYVREREQFGTPLASFQLVQYRLAKMLAEVTTMQLLCLRLAQLTESGQMTAGMASLAKMHNAARARQVVADARDVLGGNGILLENHVARHHADMEAVYTYEGTDAIQSLIVGREITGESAFTSR